MKTYFAQLTSETVQTRFKEGRPYRVWVLPDGQGQRSAGHRGLCAGGATRHPRPAGSVAATGAGAALRRPIRRKARPPAFRRTCRHLQSAAPRPRHRPQPVSDGRVTDAPIKSTAPPAKRNCTTGAERIRLAGFRRRFDLQWRFTHMPAGEYRDPVTAIFGVVAGWPDLQFAGPDRQMAFLELKRRGGRLSEVQHAMRAHLEGCGFAYLCADNVDAAIDWLKAAGILRGGFTVQPIRGRAPRASMRYFRSSVTL